MIEGQEIAEPFLPYDNSHYYTKEYKSNKIVPHTDAKRSSITCHAGSALSYPGEATLTSLFHLHRNHRHPSSYHYPRHTGYTRG